ncbi:uncharacterized protein LOC128205091 [Mya arenaria]|uniref:uncharacterized protein LOC128205091 n=1 Tax=Mya arenaria TaxID=6604 RepID=UPI0022DF0570|nr:uncharacterized protein LOC128205091 [Mya arenaria]
MDSNSSDLNRGSTTAYSTLVQCETIDITKCSGIFPRHAAQFYRTNQNIICYFGNDKIVAFSKESPLAYLYEHVSDVKWRRGHTIRSLSCKYSADSCSTALDGNRFAVSHPIASFITLYSSDKPGELKEDCKLNVEGKCYGIDFANGKLAVCFKDPPKISVLDMNTGFIHSIENEPKGNQLFTAPSNVAMDILNGQNVIYVSDKASWGLRRLTKLDIQGNILSSFLSPTDEDPKQVMAVGDGSVLFVHKGIRLMSESCQEVVKLLDESHTASVLCMSYSKQRNLLFVVKDNSTEIVVYKLS